MRVLLLVVLFVCAATSALTRDRGQYAQSDPDTKRWFNGLGNQRGGSCCSDADGFKIDDPNWQQVGEGEIGDGDAVHYRVRIDGAWIDVPDWAVVKGGNRVGYAIVWPVGGGDGVPVRIRCFLPGTLT